MSVIVSEPQIGRRVAPRTQCNMVVEIKDGAGDWKPALLMDISSTGFRLTRIGRAPSGNSIWLRPSGMDPIPARVRWMADGAIGCSFLYPLDTTTEGRIRHLLAQEGATRRASVAQC